MSENPQQVTPDEIEVNYITLTSQEHARFWSKVNKDGPMHPTIPELGRCWLWTAGVWGRGYGAFVFRGSQIKSHRLSYITEVGCIPKAIPFVLHTCDVRLCCNPGHLFLGTYASNAADMCSKDRHRTVTGDDHYSRRHPEIIKRGSQRGQSKLTEEQVADIRQRDYTKRGNRKETAKEFNVSVSTISQILRGEAWTHVP